jgi:ribose-phosphate pyrophosphokinase
MAGISSPQTGPRRRLEIFSGRGHPDLAEAIAKRLGIGLGDANLRDFPGGEIHCRFSESIRGSDVFIIQSHCPPINQTIFEMLIMIDAARRASARRIIAVCPYYGYSRQDRKSTGREPITAKLVADLLTAAGADRVVSVDLHSGQIQGFFDFPVDHLTAMPVLLEYLRAEGPSDLVIVSPDAGRVKVAERFSQQLGTDLAFVHKRRPPGSPHEVEAMEVIGNVDGKCCVVLDDMIDTSGTICAAAERLVEAGATDVWAMATHPVLSDPALERLDKSVISRVVVTDTLPLPTSGPLGKIEVLSIAPIIAKAIDAVYDDTSVSEIFGGHNVSP